MFISARIVDLELNLLLLDVLGASVDIKHGRLVILLEFVLKVVFNEAGLADGGVADEHNFDLLRPFVINRWAWARAWFRWITIVEQRRLLILRCWLDNLIATRLIDIFTSRRK